MSNLYNRIYNYHEKENAIMDKPKINIIIADNSKDFCDIFNEYLSCQEDIVVTGIANDGVEALKLIKEKKPDLVVLDIIMPILDGFGVLEQLNTTALYPMPRIIVLSSISQKKIIQRTISLGADCYVTKPCNMEKFIETIRQINSTTCSDHFKKTITHIYNAESNINIYQQVAIIA